MNAASKKEIFYMPKRILCHGIPVALRTCHSLFKLLILCFQSLSRVSFLTSQDSLGSDIDPDGTRHLLGYDWIAALLDNDRGATNHPESYFDELREFRRLNRDECVNRFYME